MPVDRNVKRWRDGKMIKRWCAAGMLNAERSFRRLNGYRQMATFGAALAACGISLQPRRSEEPSLSRVPAFVVSQDVPFEQLINNWFPVTYVLNNLNRGLGLADAYPFVWSAPAIDKLRYVHEIVRHART